MKVEWTTSELKETLLVVQAVVWGAILLIPGNSFASPSRVDLLSEYAPDTFWGVALVAANLPLLFLNRYKHRRYRKFCHAFNWTFWLAITCIALYRSGFNGFQPTDFLLVMPFFTIAILHGVIYAGLWRKI